MRFIRLAAAFVILALAACGAPDNGDSPATAVNFHNASDDTRAHGKRLAQVLGCSGCHGPGLTGQDWSDEHGVLWTANLTRSAASLTEVQLEAAIRQGVRPGRELWGMPSHTFSQMSDDDMTALIAYLRSVPPTGVVHPRPTFTPALRELVDKDVIRSSRADVALLGAAWPPDMGETHAFARYATRATCAECHGMDLKGEDPPLGGASRPDLRIAAAYSREEFHTLMRTGAGKGGRELELMSDVARDRYSGFTDAEIDAIYDYLTALAAAPAQ